MDSEHFEAMMSPEDTWDCLLTDAVPSHTYSLDEMTTLRTAAETELRELFWALQSSSVVQYTGLDLIPQADHDWFFDAGLAFQSYPFFRSQ